MVRTKRLDRVPRIRGTLPLQFATVDLEVIHSVDGGLQHAATIDRRGDGPVVRLLPWVTGRQKGHNLDVELFPRRLGESKVSDVGWIERPPEECAPQDGASTSPASIGGSRRRVPPTAPPGHVHRCGSTYVSPLRTEMWTA